MTNNKTTDNVIQRTTIINNWTEYSKKANIAIKYIKV